MSSKIFSFENKKLRLAPFGIAIRFRSCGYRRGFTSLPASPLPSRKSFSGPVFPPGKIQRPHEPFKRIHSPDSLIFSPQIANPAPFLIIALSFWSCAAAWPFPKRARSSKKTALMFFMSLLSNSVIPSKNSASITHNFLSFALNPRY